MKNKKVSKTEKITEAQKAPKTGDKIYVDSSFHISRGSEDVVGGLATVINVYNDISGGESCVFVEVAEHPGHGYNWSQFLSREQDNLKKEFGKKKAYPYPDIDTPWIEKGDWVDGHEYNGRPIW